MNLLLVCETPIIEHIFTLVCKKMKIDLTIQKNNKVNKNYDLIVIDQNFVDSKFNKIKNHLLYIEMVFCYFILISFRGR